MFMKTSLRGRSYRFSNSQRRFREETAGKNHPLRVACRRKEISISRGGRALVALGVCVLLGGLVHVRLVDLGRGADTADRRSAAQRRQKPGASARRGRALLWRSGRAPLLREGRLPRASTWPRPGRVQCGRRWRGRAAQARQRQRRVPVRSPHLLPSAERLLDSVACGGGAEEFARQGARIERNPPEPTGESGRKCAWDRRHTSAPARSPVIWCFSLVRTKADPFPGLTWRNSAGFGEARARRLGQAVLTGLSGRERARSSLGEQGDGAHQGCGTERRRPRCRRRS